jgi:hypothetical protein
MLAESNRHEPNLPIGRDLHHPRQSTEHEVQALLASLQKRQPPWHNFISKWLKYPKPTSHVYTNQNYRSTYEMNI